MKEAAARDRVTLRKFLRSSGLRKSEGQDLKETEMDWVRRRELVGRRKLALISSSFFLFFSSFKYGVPISYIEHRKGYRIETLCDCEDSFTVRRCEACYKCTELSSL